MTKLGNKNILPKVLLWLSSAFWGASFVFTKGLFLTEPHITTLAIVTGRLLIASAFFIPLLALTHKLEHLRKEDLPIFFLLSFAEPFLYFLLETAGVKRVPPSLASIIVATIPIFVPFAMAAVYKERLRLRAVLGVLLSLAGVVLMLLPEEGGLLEGNVLDKSTGHGILFLFGAVAVGVTYVLVLSKVIKNYHPITITAYQNAFSLVYFVPLLLLCDADVLPLLSYAPGMWLRLAFLGVFCSTIAYVCYNYGIVAIGATAATVYNNVIPVFSLLLAVALGQENFCWTKVLGMAIVMVGLWLATAVDARDKD